MLEEYMEPWRKAMLEDKESAAKLRLDYNTVLERLHELECYALIQEWKLKPARQFWAMFDGGPDGNSLLRIGPTGKPLNSGEPQSALRSTKKPLGKSPLLKAPPAFARGSAA